MIPPKNSAIGEMNTKIQWAGTNSPLVYDAYVSWGDPVPLVRGTIPDVRISSKPTKIDDQDDDSEGYVTDGGGTNWLNFTDQYINGGLWFRVDPTAVTPPDRTDKNITTQYRKQYLLGTRPTN